MSSSDPLRCAWNQEENSSRECRRWDSPQAPTICEACESTRNTWLIKLEAERKDYPRQKVVALLNRLKSYTACKLFLDSLRQQDDEQDARRAAENPIASNAIKVLTNEEEHNYSSEGDVNDDADDDAFSKRRMMQHEAKKKMMQDKRDERRKHLREQESMRKHDQVRNYQEIPEGFFVMSEIAETSSKVFPDDQVEWDESECVCCWKCKQPTVASRKNAQQFLVGERNHLYRPMVSKRYGKAVCVPVLLCASGVTCRVGLVQTVTAIWWRRRWVPLEEFLEVEEGEESLLDVPCELCRERVILHLLHWFSRTKEAREDDHAGFPLPGLDREARIVIRQGKAAGYCTFTSQILEGEETFRLPTLYNIFIRKNFRGMGCAKQLLEAFFRPHTIGKSRTRRVVKQADGKFSFSSSPIPQPSLDQPSLDIIDMLQIDPPVSNALCACIEKVFTSNERSNMICDSSSPDGGVMVVSLDPCDPKIRVLRLPSCMHFPLERNEEGEVVIGQIS